ncbi:diguanylate cyclase [Natronospirillum operosum]|nr:diguanylate cyclase [Natronospirillum operosum]
MSTDNKKIRELQQHFSRRVISDARLVVDQWYQLHRQRWQKAWFQTLQDRVERLLKSARRYERKDMEARVEPLLALLHQCDEARPPGSEMLAELADHIGHLGKLAIRQQDHTLPGLAAFAQPEVYVAIEQVDLAADMQHQLESFGISTALTPDQESLQEARAWRRPLGILIDVNFRRPGGGFDLIEAIQSEVAEPISVIFFHQGPPDMETRLRAMRAGGKGFVDVDSSLLRVVEQLERESRVSMPELYRVLVVDDSRTQAQHAAQTLNSAGMITRILADPLALLSAVDEFEPDIILMDMYMPRCNGVELATVMRQQPRYDRLPIIFLSAEEDMAKQMDALAEGGDDFLTKPVHPSLLIATVQHRCKRNRAMRFWMERDALTGLFDHTHLLQRLDQEANRAARQQTPLSFAMLDLDKFKAVNDTWGHAAGDRVLKNLSLLLRQRLRKTDVIGRYGGEEFAVIMPETEAGDAFVVLSDLLEAFGRVRHPVSDASGRRFIHCSFSGGLAQLDTDETPAELAVRADQALYQAKADGRSRLCILNP